MRLYIKIFFFFLVLFVGYVSMTVDRTFYRAGSGISHTAGIEHDNINAFLSTRNSPGWFANRKGNPFNFNFYPPKTCEAPAQIVPGPESFNFVGEKVQLTGYSNDCIYRHSPGSGELLYHFLFGEQTSIFKMRFFPLILNCFTFILAVSILELSMGLMIALMGTLLFFFTGITLAWFGDLLYVPFECFFFALSVWATLYSFEKKSKFLFWFGQLALFLHLLFSFKFFTGNFIALFYILYTRDKKLLKILIVNAFISVVLFILPRFLAEPQIFTVLADRVYGKYGFTHITNIQYLRDIPVDMFGLVLTPLIILLGVGVGVSNKNSRLITIGLFIIGISFWIVFPSTSIFHFWWNTLHLAPFCIWSFCLMLQASEKIHRYLPVLVFLVLLTISGTKIYNLKFGDGWISDSSIRSDMILTQIANREDGLENGLGDLFDGKVYTGIDMVTSPLSIQIYLQKKVDKVRIDYYLMPTGDPQLRRSPAEDCQVFSWASTGEWVPALESQLLSREPFLIAVRLAHTTDLIQIKCQVKEEKDQFYIGEIGVSSLN